jgi:hypothetical protein
LRPASVSLGNSDQSISLSAKTVWYFANLTSHSAILPHAHRSGDVPDRKGIIAARYEPISVVRAVEANRIWHRLARCEGVPLMGSRIVASTVALKFAPSGLKGS